MRFEYYHDGLAAVPKLSVDGTVDNAVHFSHWNGNSTPGSVKADTSTEIALNLVASPNREELTQGIELVTNNHFDTDGVLSVWTVLNGERALDHANALIAAAEAGDFTELSTEDGVRASIVIQGSDDPTDDSGSPLARHLNGGLAVDDERAYALVLPEVENVITRTDRYEFLWRDFWDRIVVALESFAKGSSRVTEYVDDKISLVTLAEGLHDALGFRPATHAAPLTAITKHAKGQLFLIADPQDGGWSYRIDYPYYSWAETVVRPRIIRRDLKGLIARLNSIDTSSAGEWKTDSSELSSAIKYSGPDGSRVASRLDPESVAGEVRSALREAARATVAT